MVLNPVRTNRFPLGEKFKASLSGEAFPSSMILLVACNLFLWCGFRATTQAFFIRNKLLVHKLALFMEPENRKTDRTLWYMIPNVVIRNFCPLPENRETFAPKQFAGARGQFPCMGIFAVRDC